MNSSLHCRGTDSPAPCRRSHRTGGRPLGDPARHCRQGKSSTASVHFISLSSLNHFLFRNRLNHRGNSPCFRKLMFPRPRSPSPRVPSGLSPAPSRPHPPAAPASRPRSPGAALAPAPLTMTKSGAPAARAAPRRTPSRRRSATRTRTRTAASPSATSPRTAPSARRRGASTASRGASTATSTPTARGGSSPT